MTYIENFGFMSFQKLENSMNGKDVLLFANDSRDIGHSFYFLTVYVHKSMPIKNMWLRVGASDRLGLCGFSWAHWHECGSVLVSWGALCLLTEVFNLVLENWTLYAGHIGWALISRYATIWSPNLQARINMSCILWASCLGWPHCTL